MTEIKKESSRPIAVLQKIIQLHLDERDSSSLIEALVLKLGILDVDLKTLPEDAVSDDVSKENPDLENSR